METPLLSELIQKTKNSIHSLNHSQSTLYQYDLAWKELSSYFQEQGQIFYSKPLAQRFIRFSGEAFEKGDIKLWRYKLRPLAVQMLIEVHEKGSYTWNCYKKDPNESLSETLIKLYQNYISDITMIGKGNGTIHLYQTVSRQFLKYVQFENHKAITELQLADISQFIPYISKYYQPTSMRTLLSSLRCFLRYLEDQKFTPKRLSLAVPSSGARKTLVIPTITIQEEQAILNAIDRNSTLGKRNYAMFLLALGTGLRSIDIANLKLLDIKWKTNTIEIA